MKRSFCGFSFGSGGFLAGIPQTYSVICEVTQWEVSMRRIVPALAVFLFATSAAAQNGPPFCLVDANGTRCWYYDLPSCQRDARASGGGCVVNQQQATPPPQSDVWGAFNRGANAGRRGADQAPPNQAVPTSNLGPVIEQFCRDLQRQDIAELEAMPVRSERCFAMARAAR